MTAPRAAAKAVPNRSWTAQDSFVAIIPALLIAVLVMFGSSTVLLGGDTLAHIAAGQWMIQHGAVPHSDPFSYTFLGKPWNAHEWLSEVLMAQAYRLGGLSGLYALFGFAGAATVFFLALTLLRFLPPIPALIVLTLPLAYLGGHVQARPYALALPILIFWMGELLAARAEDRAPSWLLIPLVVLWVNLHASFILGLCLLAPFALEVAITTKEKWRETMKPWGVITAGALASALANPAGLSGLLFPLKFMGTPALSVILEWQSAVFVGLDIFELCLLGALFYCLMRGVRMPTIRLLLLLGLLHEALQHRRHILVIMLLGSMLLAEPIAPTLKPKARTQPAADRHTLWTAGAGALLFMLVVSVRLAVSMPLTEDRFTPIAAIAHVPEAVLRQPVFNDFNLGAYLIFRGVRPFIDGRAELYGDAFIANYTRVVTEQDKAARQATFAKYGIVWTVFAPGNPFNAILDELPGWRILYRDKFAVVRVRTTLSPIAND